MQRKARASALALLCACASAPRPAPPAEGPAAAQPPVAPSEAQAPRPTPPPAALPPEPAPVRTAARLVLGAVGDVLMQDAVKDAAVAKRAAPAAGEDGFGWLWADVSDLLSAPDVTFANLESPVAPRSGKGSRSFVFNAPPAAVRELRAAGVDVVSVANNHLFDQGREGFLETLRELDAAGMAWAGAGEPPAEAGPRRLEAGGISLAILAWSRFFNDAGNECPRGASRPCVQAALLDPDRAVAAVRQAAGSADAVVVSLHWGEEYADRPREEDVALAHRLADAGALVVVGHHPHVLQPIELYRRPDGKVAVIAYSLGNFVSNQSRYYVPGATPDRVAATRDGAILRVALARRDYGRGVVAVEVAGADYVPLWTENDTAELDLRRDPKAHPTIRVVSLDRALARVRAEIATFPDPVPSADRARYVRLR
jgi:poly-gamma-glutamate capsule biosynthesis protein CapA/YwtB (metallophosphatase superfamily)